MSDDLDSRSPTDQEREELASFDSDLLYGELSRRQRVLDLEREVALLKRAQARIERLLTGERPLFAWAYRGRDDMSFIREWMRAAEAEDSPEDRANMARWLGYEKS